MISDGPMLNMCQVNVVRSILHLQTIWAWFRRLQLNCVDQQPYSARETQLTALVSHLTLLHSMISGSRWPV